MPAYRKARPRGTAANDRQFEDLLRRASNFLNRRPPTPPVRALGKKHSKAA